MAEQTDGTGLPTELTSYIGRLGEAADARKLLETGPLLTLSGTGGVGKTRLAGRVAAEVADDVVFVRLAEVRDATLLAGTVADAIGLRDQSGRDATDVVVAHLRDRRMLLVLDNGEHLVDALAEFVAAVLAACPHVSILVTSRQPIGAPGERVLTVPPLAVPGDVRTMADLESYDAVRLLIDRARAVVPSFAVTEDNLADLTRLSQELEGLPLAIELAAVRLRSLSMRQVADRLSDRLALLTGGSRTAPLRQQTLRATIDWSYGLCSEQEQLIWARAAAFSGTFDLAAAEHVCAGAGVDSADVADLVASLVDKSVLVGESGRFRMLETLREYGLDRLAEAGDRTRVSRRHRDWYAEVAARFQAAWIGPDQVALIAALRRDYPNIRVALDFCVTEPGEAEVGVRMVARIVDYWSVSGMFAELLAWLDRALAVLPGDLPERVTALRVQGWTALFVGDAPTVAATFTEAGELLAQRPDEVEAAYVAAGWGVAGVFSGNVAAAVEPLEAAIAGFEANQVARGLAFIPTAYGLAVGLALDHQRGRAVLSALIDRCVELGEIHWRAWALCVLAFLDMAAAGDATTAEGTAAEALRRAHEVGTVEIESFTMEVVATIAAHQGDYVRSATMFGIADARWTSMGSSPAAYAPLFELRERYVALVRGELGDPAFDQFFAQGQAMRLDAAMRYALGESSESTSDSALTKRQKEIAELVAQGLTNRQIADRLVISLRTVDSHVDSILNKLGIHSRTDIAPRLP